MTDRPSVGNGPRGEPVIGTNVAHAARVYDYMLGGVTNFEVDREAAEQAAAVVGGMDRVRSEVRANRAFLGRAVQYVITEAGIRQFLDIGTGIPNADNVHAVAQATAPDSRIVYVDKDPIVVAHAHELLASTPEGATAFLLDDLRNPDSILEQAADTLDFGTPITVMLVGLLHHFRDEDDPAGLIAPLLDAVCPDSYLVLSHLASDIQPEEMAKAAEHLNEAMEEPWIPRAHAEVARFFDGLELVEPGVVQVDQWRTPTPPPAPEPGLEGWVNPLYVGVARKP